MTRTEFENTLQEVVQSLLPTTVLAIFANENGPRPSATYVTIHTMERHDLGQPVYPKTDVNGVQIVSWDEDVSVSLQCFGPNAYDTLGLLAQRFKLHSTLELLQIADIVVRDIGDIKDITEAIDNVFEKRASVDIVFGIAQSISDTVGWIERAEIEQVD